MRLAVLGATGRTGSAVAALADATEGVKLLSWDGRSAVPDEAEVLIDFSAPAALAGLAAAAAAPASPRRPSRAAAALRARRRALALRSRRPEGRARPARRARRA